MRRPRLALVAAVSTLFAAAPATHARADDVTAVVAGGSLRIKGDADANKLELDQIDLAAGQVRVNGSPTTINGAPGPVVLDGITRGATIDLGDGDDELDLEALTLAGAVRLKMGAGDDIVTSNGGHYGAALTVDLGLDDGILGLCGGSVGGSVMVKIGPGAGTSHLVFCSTTASLSRGTAVDVEGVDIAGGLTIRGSTANEGVKVVDTTVGGRAKLTLGGGSDAVALCEDTVTGSVGIQMGTGVAGTTLEAECSKEDEATGENAVVVAGGTTEGSLSIRTGASNDAVWIGDNPTDAAVKVDLGQGDNFVTLAGGGGGSLVVRSGAGADVVRVRNATITTRASVTAGAGPNDVRFASTSVGGSLTVTTGNDDDVIDTSGASAESKTIRHGKGNDTVTE